MYTIMKIKSLKFIVFVCILVIIISINTNYVVAQAKTSTPTTSSSAPLTSGSSCIVCPTESPKCPDCSSSESCVVTIRSCNKCPIARCESLSSNSLQGNNNSPSGGGGPSSLIPAIVGSVVGVVVLAVAGYGYFIMRKRSKSSNAVGSGGDGNNNGNRSLDNFDEKETTLDSENVIPIAYIPPSTQSRTTSTLSDSRSFESSLYYASAGTTPLASPLPCMLNVNNDDCYEDFRESGDIGTIIQATKAVATTPNAAATNTTPTTATLITATRAKPALVRINTIKSNGLNDSSTSLSSSTTVSKNPSSPKKSENTTPKTSSPTGNSFLSAINSLISSVPSSPTTRSESEMSIISIPKIDIEGSSFLHRESILSASSSNGRSTMLSDEGEIMIFWGGDNPTFIDIDCTSSSSPSAAKNDNNEDKNDDDDDDNNNNDDDDVDDVDDNENVNNDNGNSNRESNVSADN